MSATQLLKPAAIFTFLSVKLKCPATFEVFQEIRFICVAIVNSIMIDMISLSLCGSRLLLLRHDDTNLQPTASFLRCAIS